MIRVNDREPSALDACIAKPLTKCVGQWICNIKKGARDAGQMGFAFAIIRQLNSEGLSFPERGFSWNVEWLHQADLTIVLASTLAGGMAGAFRGNPRLSGVIGAAMAVWGCLQAPVEQNVLLQFAGSFACAFVMSASAYAIGEKIREATRLEPAVF